MRQHIITNIITQNLIYKGESVCVCPVQKYILLDQSSLNLVWGPNFTRARSQAMFWPLGCTPGSGGPKQGLQSIYSLNCETRQKFYKTKVVGNVFLVGADHIFGPVIRIWKNLGPMCFWCHGQSFSGKVYETKVIVHFSNRKVGQVLTHTPISLTLPRVRGPKWAQGNFVACMSRGKNC